jgi:N-acetylglucosamine-6-phosphate deacetylase
MTRLRLSGPTLTANGAIEPATILVEEGRILEVQGRLDPGADIVTDGVIAPGFIDLQVNGGYGYDFTADPTTIAAVAERLPQTGVTGFLPTCITSPIENYPAWLRQATASVGKWGAQVLGFHLEGPYFSPAKIGAHNPAWIRAIEVEEALDYANSPLVRIVTLAPELPGALAAIAALRGRGVIVSAGHSNATYDEALAGFAAGIHWGTHLFNAMRDFKPRQPGLPGALLTTKIPCGLIADGVHVHPAALRLAWLAKGVAGITLVTDAMAAMGMPPGQYHLGAGQVTVDQTSARLADGTLAGSIATMLNCVRGMMAASACNLAEALLMASRSPADLLDLAHKGRVAPGCDADLVVLNANLQVSHTLVMGELAWSK